MGLDFISKIKSKLIKNVSQFYGELRDKVKVSPRC
jgi:hypothetical protein